MPGPVVTIDEAIRDTNVNISLISYDGFTKSLAVQTRLWVDGMFGSNGVFPKGKVEAPGARQVSNWSALNRQAFASIEGAAPGASTVQSTSLVQIAVIRALYAAKQAAISGQISTAQRSAVIAVFNTAWGI